MIKYIITFIAGGIFFTVGFSGVANMLDNGKSKLQEVAKEAAK
jgi:hypothetical protein